jgi:hypothetical protein
MLKALPHSGIARPSPRIVSPVCCNHQCALPLFIAAEKFPAAHLLFAFCAAHALDDESAPSVR